MTKRRTEAKVIKVDFGRERAAKTSAPASRGDVNKGVWRVSGLRVPFAREGAPFILLSILVTAFVFMFQGLWWLKAPFIGSAIFVAAFFRDPEREIPEDPKSIVSPADGRVIKVEKVRDGRFLKADALKISIFMNVFNVHVNRAPADSRVLKVVYNKGTFFNASLDKASLDNEQNAVIAEGPGDRRFVFNQIAGLIARRIVCRVKPGETLSKGQRFGLIRFGSRVDVYLPADCVSAVGAGEKVRAGSSIIGYWR